MAVMPEVTTSNLPRDSTGAARIRESIARAKALHRCALLPFLTAGYPDLRTTERLLAELPAAGADLIEVGFPFSDPIADGPVIAESMHKALGSGVNPEAIFACVRAARPSVPVLAMVSHSIVHRIGVAHFIKQAVEAGFAGFIVPDADPNDAMELSKTAASHGAGFCGLVSPSSSPERVREIVSISTGFVYLLARAGVTGVSTDAPEISMRARELRALTDAPIVAGFGISSARHVEVVGRDADGAIVGSALVRAMTHAVERNESAVDAALTFLRTLKPEAPQS